MNTIRSQQRVEEFFNTAFTSQRTTQEFSQTLQATAETVWPLLCATREADWLPGSAHKIVHSDTGYAEPNYIFQSDFFGFGQETWVRYQHDPWQALAYIRFSENLVIDFRIRLHDHADGTVNARFELMFTGITEKGNAMIEKLPEELPLGNVMKALQHYIDTDEQIDQ